MTKVKLSLLLIGVAGYSFMLYSPALRTMALQGFYLVIPIFAALVLFPEESRFRNGFKSTPKSIESGSRFGRHFWPAVALFLALQLISLAVVRLDKDRNTVYYTLMFASLLLVCWQAVRVTRTSKPLSFIVLVEIGLLLSNVVSSKFLCYYYYFGGGDSIVHSHFVDLISATGRLQPEMGSYEFFPLTHVIAVIVKEISGIGLTSDSLYWPFVAIAFASPFAVYKIAQRIGFEQPIPMLSALMVPAGSLTVRFYSDALPQGLVFFLAFVLIMCALASSRRLVLGIPILLLICSLTFTHQVTVLFALVGVVVAGFFAARLNSGRSRNLSKQTSVLSALIYLSYFALVSIAFYQVVLYRFTFIPDAPSVLDKYVNQGHPTSSYLLISALRHSGTSLMIFFITIVIGTILMKQERNPSRTRLELLALLAVVLIVYFPSPLSFSRLVSENLLLWRMSHFAEPVVLIAAVVGISRFANNMSRRRMIGVAVTVAIIIFTAIASSVNDMDDPWIGGDSYQLKTYFIESDLRAMDFVRLNVNGLTVYSDLPASIYLIYEGVHVSNLTAFENNTLAIQGDRFVLFRLAEFELPGCQVIIGDYPRGISAPFRVRVADATPLSIGSQVIFDDGRNLCAITMNPIVLSVSR